MTGCWSIKMNYRYLLMLCMLSCWPFSQAISAEAEEAPHENRHESVPVVHPQALEEYVQQLARLSSILVYNLDTVSLTHTLTGVINNNPRILSITVIDSISDDVFLNIYKYEGGVYYTSNTSSEFASYPVISTPIIHQGEKIADLKIGYDRRYGDEQFSFATKLTKAEKQWLIDNQGKTFRVGVEPWMPISFFDNRGQVKGIMIDYLSRLEVLLGVNFSYRGQYIKSSVEGLKEGDIDIISGVFYHPSRLNVGIHSDELFNTKNYIYVRSDNTGIHRQEDLQGKRVGVVAGSIYEVSIAKAALDIEAVRYHSAFEAMEKLRDNEVDAVLDADLSVSYIQKNHGMLGVRSIDQNIIPAQGIHLLMDKNQPIMASVLNKALRIIDKKSGETILESYLSEEIKSSPYGSYSARDIFILSMLAMMVFAILFYLSNNDKVRELKTGFGSKNFENLMMATVSVFVGFVVLLSLYLISRNKLDTEDKTLESMSASLNAIDERLSKNHQLYSSLIKSLTKDEEFVTMVEQALEALNRSDLVTYKASILAVDGYLDKYNIFSDLNCRQVFDLQGGFISEKIIDEKIEIIKTYRDEFERAISGEIVTIAPKINASMSDSYTGAFKVFSPIKSLSGKTIAVLVDVIDKQSFLGKVVADLSYGDSGEILVSTESGLLLSNSRFTDEVNHNNDINIYRHRTSEMERSSMGYKHNEFFIDFKNHDLSQYLSYRNIEVLGISQWNPDLKILLSSQMDVEEVFGDHDRLNYSLIGVLILMLSFTIPSILFTLIYGRRATDSLESSKEMLEKKVKERTLELEESEERGRLILSSIGQGLIGFDGAGQVIFVNDAALELLKYSARDFYRKDFMSKVYHDVSHHDQKISPLEVISNIASGAVFINKKLTFEDSNGRQFPVEISSKPIVRNYVVEGGLMVFSDIDQRVRMERDLEVAKDAAENASKAKSDFLANMSHEIRTPMNAILGMSSLALNQKLGSTQRNYIEKVHRSANTLLEIINDILDLSKIESGKLELETSLFLFEDILIDLFDMIGIRAEEKSLELLYDLKGDFPKYFVADQLRLFQVLVNLASNAVKFTDAGSVVLSAQVRSREEEHCLVEFSLTDTGIGLSSVQIERLFQSFNQADTSTTRQYGGTGLGLAICKRLVDLMEGDIWVDSELGQGSRFCFTANLGLPAAVDQGHYFEKVDQQWLPMQVLVVDDNAQARLIIKNLVVQLGMSCDTVASGEEALGSIKEDPQRYQLVLLDWKMPNMDGLQCAKAIRTLLGNDHDLKIMMITAFARESLSREEQQGLIDACLSKPVLPTQFMNKIRSLFDEKNEPEELPFVSSNKGLERSYVELAGAHVLLVEDNALNQELAVAVLGNSNIQVTTAIHGKEALALLEQSTFDAVLMDCQMPVMDGYEATANIRQQAKWANLPILAMTADVMSSDRQRVLIAGMNDHISKPIDADNMLNTLAKWIHREPHTRSSGNAVTDPVVSQKLKREDQQADALLDFTHIEGVNASQGLKVCQNNQNLYRHLLIQFVDSNINFREQFLVLSNTKANTKANATDDNAKQRLVHTLKGTSANIAANTIYELCSVLENAVSNDDEPLYLAKTG